MTTRYKTLAFVFKKNDINESNRIFSVFTDDFGRLDVFAKAIRKSASKLRSGIDTFFMSDIEFIQGKNKKTLTDASVVEKFGNVAQDLERFKTANGIGEILDNFIKGEEKDKDIFNLVNESFCELNDRSLNAGKCALVYYHFLWSILSLLGYSPEVQRCVSCGDKLTPYGIYFSAKEGSIICKKCLDKDKFAQKINSDVVKILRIVLSKDWQTMFKLKIEPASWRLFKEISDSYYSYILGHGIQLF